MCIKNPSKRTFHGPFIPPCYPDDDPLFFYHQKRKPQSESLLQHGQYITTIHGGVDDDNVQNQNRHVVNYDDSDSNNNNFICSTKMVLLWSCGFTAFLTYFLVWVVRNYVLVWKSHPTTRQNTSFWNTIIVFPTF